MTNYGYHPDIEHLSSEHTAGKDTSQTKSPQHPSRPRGAQERHVGEEFKNYFCPFCGYRLFRGKVRDFRMVCHECNRLVDSRALEEEQS